MPASPPPALAPLLQKLQRRSDLTALDCDALLALPYRLIHVEAGTYLMRDGDAPQACHVLLYGSICRHKVARDGWRQILSVHFSGDLLGFDQGLLETADYNVQSVARSDIAVIPYQAVQDLGVAAPNIGRALCRDALVDASISREWIVNVSRRDARERIAHLICELVILQGKRAGGNSRQVDWWLTQEQLGDATGLTAVHVNRTLQRLRSDALIETQRNTLVVLDWTALKNVAGFNPAYLHLPMTNAVQ